MKISKKILFSLLVLIVVFISYGQTLQMYFWQDDSALIFKLQHPEGPAGSYGAGIIGEGAYKYLITPFVPFFPIFGMNPAGYFMIGLLAYALAALSFYLFSAELFQNKKVGFFSTLIFAAGYIGSGTMFRISNSWQTNFGIILALLSFWIFLVFLRQRERLKYYLLGLGFFFLAVEFVYVRSHSLILPILALDVLITLVPFNIRAIAGLILRQIPFLIIFYYFYLRGGTMGSAGLGNIIKQLISGKIEILASLFATVGNALIPNTLQNNFIALFQPREGVVLLIFLISLSYLLLRLFSASQKLQGLSALLLFAAFLLNRFIAMRELFWYRAKEDIFSGALGLYLIILIFVISLALWRKQKNIAAAVLFGLVVLISQFFGYFIQYPQAIFTTTHRYLSYSFIGYCLIFGGLCFVLFQRSIKLKSLKYHSLLGIFPIMLVLTVNLVLGVKYQREIVQNRSQPTRNFYEDLKQAVPNIQKGALFYFDVEGGVRLQQFNDFFSVGSMPNQTALAIYYNVDRYDLAMVTDLDELLFKLSTEEAGVDNTHAFYFGQNGLVNTTSQLRDILKKGASGEIPLQIKQDSPTSVSLTGDESSPVLPLLLTVKAKVLPIEDSSFPYSEGSSSAYSQKKENFNIQEQDRMISYLLSRQDYYETVSVSSLSQWKYQEIPNIVDNNLSTSWKGHRIYWHDHHHEQITFDLGSAKQIASIAWVNWNHTSTPTAYTIESSLDGTHWVTLKKTTNGSERKDRERVVENFEEIRTRFVRMDFTATLSGDSPVISEFEVVRAPFNNVNVIQTLKYIENPFIYIDSRDEMELIFAKAAPLLYLNAEIETDKGKRKAEVPIGQFSNDLTYQFILNAGGTNIKSLTVSVPDMPVKIEVKSAVLSNLSLHEFEERGLIKQFVKN